VTGMFRNNQICVALDKGNVAQCPCTAAVRVGFLFLRINLLSRFLLVRSALHSLYASAKYRIHT